VQPSEAWDCTPQDFWRFSKWKEDLDTDAKRGGKPMSRAEFEALEKRFPD
jgi:hypothetical protein